MLTYCNGKGIMYLDTVVEPWLGGYFDGTPSERSNYAQREEMLALKVKFGPDAPTAVVTHGANPGLVSHFVKQALLNIAKDTGVEVTTPRHHRITTPHHRTAHRTAHRRTTHRTSAPLTAPPHYAPHRRTTHRTVHHPPHRSPPHHPP